MTTRPLAFMLSCALPVGLALAALPARAAQSYEACTGFITSVPATITTQGTWCMDRDLATSLASGSAIIISTNNVTLDCNHFKLGGLGAGPNSMASGVSASGRLNTTIRNCNIRGFRTGVALSGSGHLVEDSRFDFNLLRGIQVLGDGSVIRRNQVRDTGEANGEPLILGIYGEGSVDVLDNLITGVRGPSGGNTSAWGIWIYGGVGARAARNTVRDLVPTGTGNAQGIYTSNGSKVFLDDNRVVLASPLAGSVGFRCNALGGSLRGNTAWGFSSLTSSCLDDGGNVQR